VSERQEALPTPTCKRAQMSEVYPGCCQPSPWRMLVVQGPPLPQGTAVSSYVRAPCALPCPVCADSPSWLPRPRTATKPWGHPAPDYVHMVPQVETCLLSAHLRVHHHCTFFLPVRARPFAAGLPCLNRPGAQPSPSDALALLLACLGQRHCCPMRQLSALAPCLEPLLACAWYPGRERLFRGV